MVILLIIIVYSYLFPSDDSIFKSTDFNSIMGDIADIFVNGIFFIPILIKVFVIVIVIIIQITATFSKKNKRKLNYVASIMNLVTSIIVFIIGLNLFFGSISLNSVSLISSSMIIQGMLTFDIIASILIISSNRKEKEQKLDLYNIEK